MRPTTCGVSASACPRSGSTAMAGATTGGARRAWKAPAGPAPRSTTDFRPGPRVRERGDSGGHCRGGSGGAIPASSRAATPTATAASASWSCGTWCSCSSSRTRAKELTPLPAPNIDTGMGLERAAVILQNARTVYDTDLFQPIVQRVCELAGKEYGRECRDGPRCARRGGARARRRLPHH